jgi:hypothetical protein
LQVGEAKIDRDAPALLFRKTVAVDSSEGFDQRRFAVVYVTGGAYDNVSHWGALMLSTPLPPGRS